MSAVLLAEGLCVYDYHARFAALGMHDGRFADMYDIREGMQRHTMFALSSLVPFGQHGGFHRPVLLCCVRRVLVVTSTLC